MNKKKIIFLLHLPPPHHGASAVGMQLKNSQLIKRKFNVTFYNISTSKSLNFSLLKSLLLFIKKTISIFRLLNKNQPDLIYYTMTSKGIAFIKDFFIVFLLTRKYKKIVLHFHNKGVKNNNNFYFRPLYKYIFRKCHVILLSEKLSYDVEDYDLYKSLNFCPNGISFPKSVNKELNSQHKKYDFLFLSNLIIEKGVVDFIKACEKLKELCKEGFRAAIVGKPADISIDELKAMVQEHNLLNYIDVLGPLYNDEKVNIFKNSKVFVFPTYYHYECFPLVIIEAMSFKLPIISTNEGAIEDLIINGFNGLIARKKDFTNLCSKMHLLLMDSNKIEIMGKNSYKHYNNNFTEGHFYNNFVNVLNNILDYE